MVRTIGMFTLLYLLFCVAGCHSYVREPAFTHEQYVRDSTAVNQFMLDSLPEGSRYVDLGLRLIKCDAFPDGRLVEHSYQSTNEVIPPVHQLYFHFTHDGKIQRIMTKNDFIGSLAASGSPMYYHEVYE